MFTSMYNAFFGDPPTIQQVIVRKKLDLEQLMRQFERERNRNSREQQKMVPEMKRMARDGQMSAVKLQARSMRRLQKQNEQLVKARVQMQAICIQLDSMRTTHELSRSMYSAMRVMRGMNHALNLESTQRMMHEFERQNEMMAIKNEAMDDAISDAMEDSDDEEEEEAVLQRILDDVGIDLSQQLTDVPGAKLAHTRVRRAKAAAAAKDTSEHTHSTKRPTQRKDDNNDDDDDDSGGGGGVVGKQRAPTTPPAPPEHWADESVAELDDEAFANEMVARLERIRVPKT